MAKPKHQQVQKHFNIKVRVGKKSIKFFPAEAKNKGEIITVKPYNAETTKRHSRDVGWSHGFAHFEVREWGNKTMFCGSAVFDRVATPVKGKTPKF